LVLRWLEFVMSMVLESKAKGKLIAFSFKYIVDATSKSSSVGARKQIQVAVVKLASHMGIENFKASDGWLWRFRNRHGMCNKITHGEAGSTPTEDIEPFRDRLNDLIKSEGLLISQVYNVDETGLYWRSLPRNTQTFKNEASSPGRKVNKERFSDEVLVGDSRDSEDEEDEEPLPKKPKLSVIRESLDNKLMIFSITINILEPLGNSLSRGSIIKPVHPNPAAAVEPAADSGHPQSSQPSTSGGQGPVEHHSSTDSE
ncbi:Tigger transposable element-derived protein 7-like 33, partial [Homarus americanus]